MSEQLVKDWHSRDYLPRFDGAPAIQFITFRLADSLPRELLLRRAQAHSREERVGWMREAEALLDSGQGCCALRHPNCARIMQETLLHFDGERYKLLAWVIMLNHVHVLVETSAEHQAPKVMRSWKSFATRMINRELGRIGQLWWDEYFDRTVRDEQQLRQALNYTEYNPVAAGLCRSPRDFAFSSAMLRGVTASQEEQARVPVAV